MPTEAELYQQFQKEKALRAQFEAEKAANKSTYKSDNVSGMDQFGLGLAESALALGNTLGLADDKTLADLKRYNAGSGAATAGSVTGDVVATALPGGVAARAAGRILPAAMKAKGFLPALGRASVAGASGGAAGEAVMGRDPVSGAVTGALAGPAVVGLGNTALGIGTQAKKFIAGAKGKAAGEVQKIFKGRVPEAVDALRDLRPSVPGERLTAGRAATANLPELKVLEQAAYTRPGANRFTANDASNAQARMNVLDRNALPGRRVPVEGPGDPTKWSPLEQARTEATDPLFRAADPNRIFVTNKLREGLTGAEATPARKLGEKSFAQQQSNARAMGTAPPIGTKGGRGTFTTSIQELAPVRDNLSKKIRALERATDATSIAKRQQLIEARTAITDEMKRQSPNYKAASDIYAEHMPAQNQADVAEQLVASLRNPAGKETGATFLKTMDDPRVKVPEIATPRQMADYNGVRQSVERELNYSNLDTRPGMVPKYLSPYEQLESDIPSFLSKAVTVAKKGLQKLGRRSDEEVQAIIDDALYNPEQFQKLLQTIPPDQAGAVMQVLRRAGMGTTGALTGASTQD